MNSLLTVVPAYTAPDVPSNWNEAQILSLLNKVQQQAKKLMLVTKVLYRDASQKIPITKMQPGNVVNLPQDGFRATKNIGNIQCFFINVSAARIYLLTKGFNIYINAA